jgi:hypothetical protein
MPSLLPQILLWGRLLLAGWWSPVVAGVTPILCLCRSCRDQATFGNTAVGGILSSSSGSGSPRWSRQPTAGAAGPLARASLPYLTPWRLLGCQPADSAALGIPLKSSPRHSLCSLQVKLYKRKLLSIMTCVLINVTLLVRILFIDTSLHKPVVVFTEFSFRLGTSEV